MARCTAYDTYPRDDRGFVSARHFNREVECFDQGRNSSGLAEYLSVSLHVDAGREVHVPEAGARCADQRLVQKFVRASDILALVGASSNASHGRYVAWPWEDGGPTISVN